MRKRLIAALLLTFGATVLLRLLFAGQADEHLPTAEAGIIDLREWEAGQGQLIPLDGEWAFYPGRFMDPAASAGEHSAGKMRQSYIQVPGSWAAQIAPNSPSEFGSGTYRLRILLPEGENLYGMRIENIRSAHKLFVNGELVSQRGVPGLSKAATAPANTPYVARIMAKQQGELELVIHAANYHYGAIGGIFRSIEFGQLADIYYKNEQTKASDSSNIRLFVGLGVMLLILFAFRRQSVELGFFGLLFLLFTVYWLSHGSKILFVTFPDMPYVWQTRTQTLTPIACAYIYVLFIRTLFPAYCSKLVIRAGTLAAIGLALIVLVAEESVFTQMETLIVGYGLTMTAYMLTVMVRGTLAKADEPLYTLAGALCMIQYALFEGLSFLNLHHTDLPPIEIAIFVICMAMLITKRFFLTLRKVEALSNELLLADRLKNDFLAHTSDELRVPIHGMTNLAQVMLEELKADERHMERLSLIVASGRRMTYLLDEINELSRLNEGAVELSRRAVDPRMTAEAVIDLLKKAPERQGIELCSHIPPGTPLLWADPNRLLQILLNLVYEALQEPGIERVAIGANQDHDAGSLWLIVTRTRREDARGAGSDSRESAMPEEGLETSVSRKLVELHGGRLEIDAAPGGMAVRFTLPMVPAAALHSHEEVAIGPTAAVLEAAAAAIAADPTPRLQPVQAMPSLQHNTPGGAKVLLADDDPVALQVMFDVLVREGLTVVGAATGVQALRELERQSDWDLVIADTMLPVLSGYDLCRHIRQRFTLSDLPVLLMTKRSGPIDLLVGFDAGANDYVSKPLDIAEFTGRIRTLLRMKQSVRDQLHMEMALIQAQIKPHFLFNALNTIAGLSETDPDGMRELLNEFGHYLRYSFDLRNLERFVPFETEWSLVTSYLHIEQARFGERIRVVAQIEDGMRFRLPPLSLQPLVENALRHGILKRFEGGTIAITVSRKAGGIRVEVSDDGVGFPKGRAEAVMSGEYRSGIGLTNVNRRLLTYYGQGLTIASEPDAGSTIGFTIPLQ
jgi:two-component system, sensor histidine kinase ChiS